MVGADGVGAGQRYTGRYLLVLGEDLRRDDDAACTAIRELSGAEEVTNTRDAERGATPRTHPTFFAELGVAVADLTGRLPLMRVSDRLTDPVAGHESDALRDCSPGPGGVRLPAGERLSGCSAPGARGLHRCLVAAAPRPGRHRPGWGRRSRVEGLESHGLRR